MTSYLVCRTADWSLPRRVINIAYIALLACCVSYITPVRADQPVHCKYLLFLFWPPCKASAGSCTACGSSTLTRTHSRSTCSRWTRCARTRRQTS